MTPEQAPILDFDHWSPEYAVDPVPHNLRYSAKCPVAYSESHGGYWFVSGYDEVSRVARDDATFSCRHDLPNGVSPYQGTQHPPTPFRVTPLEIDPPLHADWRQGLAQMFSPAAAKALEPRIREYATWCIDQHIESGRIDLVRDLTSPVPSLVNMDVLGIPLEKGFRFAELSHEIVYVDPSTEDFLRVYTEYSDAVAELIDLVHARREDPRGDVISALAHMTVGGERISDEEVMEVLNLVISAGIDTTASALACALRYLDENREARQRLIDEPELMPVAVEEFLRVYSPVQVLARTATRNVEVSGQQIREGDRVLVSWAGANVDERSFPKPTQVQIDRRPNRHAAFGLGIHRCLGSHIARMDMRIVLGEVLRRMPDYTLAEGVQKYRLIGVIQGYADMPATFTPGTRESTSGALDGLTIGH